MTFTGFIPDVDLPNIYRVADVFVNASIAELQSIVTMEAMASGLPIVAANIMALPELVHSGENGYLFSAGDIQGLSSSVVKILTQKALRERMSQKSLECIKVHDVRVIIKKYEEVYARAIEQHDK